MLRPPLPLAEVLVKLTDSTGGPDACWPWLGNIQTKGYGRLKYGPVTKSAHVWVWAHANGRYPEPGEVVRHACDNRPCVNPAHLSIGTQQDNIDDMMARGRNAPMAGEHNPMSKLTLAAVREIRSAASAGVPDAESASKYGVTKSHIRQIITRARWGWDS